MFGEERVQNKFKTCSGITQSNNVLSSWSCHKTMERAAEVRLMEVATRTLED